MASRSVEVRGFKPTDIDAVLLIQKGSPELAQWSRADYARIEAQGMNAWVAVWQGQVEAFLVARRAAKAITNDGWVRFEVPAILDHEVAVIGG